MSKPVEQRSVLPIPSPAPIDPTAVGWRDQSQQFASARSIEAPDGAPNVVVILLDDMGFGASSAFGGPCEMPATESLAANGLRYTRFHTAAMCSPTRAALLTGRNHHSVGFGHVVDQATAGPGYNARRPASAATIARILACNGYSTGAFGKMHQTPIHEVTPVGPFDRWPTADGFDKFYGFLGGEINHWQPTLYDGTAPVQPTRTPDEGYHLSEDIVDKAIDWINDVRAVTPNNRFFCYLPFGATHAPLHVSPEWVDKYRGRFDHGWNAQREITLERQKELGVIPPEANLAPWVDGIPEWDELDPTEQKAASLLMELYAGFAEHVDAQIGRFVETLERMELLDNTLIILILGDNGSSPEGGLTGTVNEYQEFNGAPCTAQDIVDQAAILGSPDTWPQYPVGWALAMDAPYQWMKQMASHYGGTRNGMVVHWPSGIAAENGALRHQWHHVIDIAPTILEAAGLPQPSIVDGTTQAPIEGVSMTYSFDNPEAAERRRTQYFELGGSRGIYHEGWVACTPHRPRPWDLTYPPPTLEEDVWELYDTTADWTQAHDLASSQPERLRKLQELFLIEAARHNVLPLDDRPLTVRRAETVTERGGGRRSMTFSASTRRMPQDLVPEVLNSSHTITASIVVPETGADGVICAQGGRFSGWSLYCRDGLLSYCHNVGAPPPYTMRATDVLPPGPHVVEYSFDYEGGGWGKGGTGQLLVDGVVVAEGRLDRTIAFLFTIGEGFDVGCDLYTTVSDEYETGNSAYSGTIDWVRIDLKEGAKPSRDERMRVELAVQ